MHQRLLLLASLLAFAGLAPIYGQQRGVASGPLMAASFAFQAVRERDIYDWLAYWAAIVLAVAVLIAVGLAFSALRWLKIQTLAAKANADFALVNARALLNAERAWIVVTLATTKEGVYTILAENVGKTPAKLVTSFADISILRAPKNLPETPAYKTQRFEGMVPAVCFPKDRRPILEISVREIIDSAYPYGNAPSNALEFIDIFFFGKITYEDTLHPLKTPESNALHETKWCFKLVTMANSAPIPHPSVSLSQYVGYT